jgi:hypothetical protein
MLTSYCHHHPLQILSLHRRDHFGKVKNLQILSSRSLAIAATIGRLQIKQPQTLESSPLKPLTRCPTLTAQIPLPTKWSHSLSPPGHRSATFAQATGLISTCPTTVSRRNSAGTLWERGCARENGSFSTGLATPGSSGSARKLRRGARL